MADVLVKLTVDAGLEIVIAGLVFWAVLLLFGSTHLWRPDVRRIVRETHVLTDLCHWFGNRVLFIPLWALLVAVGFAFAGQGGATFGPGDLAGGLPWGIQLLVSLALFDLVAYWRHRLMHTAALWPFHEVHHSSTHLNWLSGIRNHPVNTLVIYLCGAVLLSAFGFRADVLVATGTARFYWVSFIHTDIRLNLGVLNYIIATPGFHRWHHVTGQIRNRNFAGFFSLYDLAFGTFYLPKGREAEGFGLEDQSYPTDYLGQLAAPFQRLRRTTIDDHPKSNPAPSQPRDTA